MSTKVRRRARPEKDHRYDTGRVRWAMNHDNVATHVWMACTGCGQPRGVEQIGRRAAITGDGWQKEISAVALRNRMREKAIADFVLTSTAWYSPCRCGGREVLLFWGSHACLVAHRHYRCSGPPTSTI